MTEKEKMLSGQVYDAYDESLVKELFENKDKLVKYNALAPSDFAARDIAIKNILGKCGIGPCVNSPFYCDYGKNIRVGDRFFSNFNFTVLDEAYVTIGDDCFIGPNVSIYTACHSTDPDERRPARSGRSQ